MYYYFLPKDFEELNIKIIDICEKIKEIGKEMGRSCQEGAETFHDNFAHEDGTRQQAMWSNKLREMIRIRNNSRIITLDKNIYRVSIGRNVRIKDLSTEEEKILKIGSYIVFTGENTISYNSPLARLLIGAKIGDLREGTLGGKSHEFEILSIE
ncbi:MAG: GreA/GreB family elongation factor [Patescibacteria group bacterium]